MPVTRRNGYALDGRKTQTECHAGFSMKTYNNQTQVHRTRHHNNNNNSNTFTSDCQSKDVLSRESRLRKRRCAPAGLWVQGIVLCSSRSKSCK